MGGDGQEPVSLPRHLRPQHTHGAVWPIGQRQRVQGGVGPHVQVRRNRAAESAAPRTAQNRPATAGRRRWQRGIKQCGELARVVPLGELLEEDHIRFEGAQDTRNRLRLITQAVDLDVPRHDAQVGPRRSCQRIGRLCDPRRFDQRQVVREVFGAVADLVGPIDKDEPASESSRSQE